MSEYSLNASNETYLYAIYTLSLYSNYVCAIDIANYLNYTKPSVSIAIKKMQTINLLNIDSHHHINLTEYGQHLAKDIYEKYEFFKDFYKKSGMNPDYADKEAEKLMHAVSNESFRILRKRLITI